jgi:5-methylcytosine-specific restriction endonuclease McrA
MIVNEFWNNNSRLRFLKQWNELRAIVLKRDNYSCQECFVKKTAKNKVKLNVHHISGHINWEKIIDVIRQELLCSPEEMITLCYNHHMRKHGKNSLTHKDKNISIKTL